MPASQNSAPYDDRGIAVDIVSPQVTTKKSLTSTELKTPVMPLLLRNESDDRRTPMPMTRPIPGGLVRSFSKKLLTSDGIVLEDDDDEIMRINRKMVCREDEAGVLTRNYTMKGEPVSFPGEAKDITGQLGGLKKKFYEGKVSEILMFNKS